MPPTDVDTTGSSFASDPSLPILELPHATGPGTGDPFGIQPHALAIGYDRPLSLLDQLLAGDPSGGRTTFMLPYEPGFFRDLNIAFEDNLEFVTLRPRISDFPPPDPRDQALGRVVMSGIMASGAFLTPGLQDDLALAGGAVGSAASGGATANRFGSLTAAEAKQIQNFANRYNTSVTVVGSRAAGTAKAMSDFDYIIAGNSKVMRAIKFGIQPSGLSV